MKHLHIHHMASELGEYTDVECPYCGKKVELVARALLDGDTVVLDYAPEDVHPGDRVKVFRIDTEHDETYEHLSCFLGWEGVVRTGPARFEELLEGRILNRGECWVEFGRPCARHGDTGGAFLASELRKVELGG